MKWKIPILLLMSFVTTFDVCAKSLLLPTATFPKTENDINFSDRLAVKAEGYAPFAGLSAYQVIEIAEADAHLQDDIDEIETQPTTIPSEYKPQASDFLTDQPNSVFTSQTQNNIYSDVMPTGSNGYCAVRSPDIPAGQTIPLGNPTTVSISKGFCSDYGLRDMGVTDPHYGIDLGCGKQYFGTPIFATADGVIEKISLAQECKSAGNYIKIRHDSGFVSMYMHLDTILVTTGQRVTAGCQIGTMGYTGGAKVQKCPKMDIGISHLHYQIAYTGTQTNVITPKGTKIDITYQPLNAKKRPMPSDRTTKTSIDPTKFVQYSL